MARIKELFIRYKEVILYLFFGVMTTVVNFLTYAFLTRMLHVNDYAAIFVSWFIAVLFAYLTNRKLVFGSTVAERKALIKELLSFYAARIMTLILEYIIMFIGVEILKFNDLYVKLFAQVMVIIGNYLLSKLLVFKHA